LGDVSEELLFEARRQYKQLEGEAVEKVRGRVILAVHLCNRSRRLIIDRDGKP
jgi:hypothetical protein